MRWWLVLCVAVLWDTASPQPTKETSNGPDRECCPCPKDSDAASSNTLESVNPFTAASSAARATGGCPCQLRSADSEGAPSAFLPAAVRALRPFVSSDDSKEDPKPLLHPEVDLASSVLDTLREATDEEYKEALARDAARAAQEPDGIAAESAHDMVTVVLSPKDSSDDDIMAEASHAHETRCISPFGRSSLFRAPAYDSPDLLSILRLPKRKPPTFRAWNLFDMDNGVGASNINEQVVKPIFKESVVETPRSQSLAKSSSDSKSHNIPSLRVPSLFKNTDGRENSAGSILNKLRQSNKVPTKLEISKLIPKLDTSHLFRKSDNNDLSLSTNVIGKDDGDCPSNFKLKIPHISKLIPKVDSADLLKNTKEGKLRTINDNQVENSNPSKTIKLNIPHMSQLIPKIGLSKDNNVDRDFRGSKNNLKLQIPNLKASVRNNKIEANNALESDSLDSASTIKERYSSFAKVSTNGQQGLESNSVEGSDNLTKPEDKSVDLKRLEENEFKPPIKSNKINLKVPDLKLSHTPRSHDTTTDLVNNVLKGLKVPDLRDILSRDIFHLKKNDLAIKSTEQKKATEVLQNNPYSTEILDTVPSPSEPDINHVNFIEKEREDEVSLKINEKMQDMIENMPVKTEIIDSLPKTSEVNDVDHFQELEIDKSEINNDDLINAASEQTQKSLVEGAEVSELVNEMEEMNEDSIDDNIDNTSNSFMDRENNEDNIVEDVDIERDSLDEIGRDDFAAENKLDGLAINTDFQSLSEKSVPEISSNSDKHVQPTLRERIRQKLDDLKLPKVSIDFPKLTTPKNLAKTEIQIEDEATLKQDMSIEEANGNVDQVNIDDLQHMSDSLLNQEQEKKDLALEENDNLTNSNERSGLSEEVEISDSDVLESNNVNNLKKAESECIVNSISNKNAEPDIMNDSKNNEMAVGASERVASVAGPDFNLASPLRQSIILEPISFGSDSDLFNGLGIDLNNLLRNNPLPTFKMPNLLSPRGDSDIDSFSAEDDNDSYNEEFQPSMSAQPSTSNFRSSLPSLQPLEDINLDILQLKPLSADLPTLPRLNLNSFKTRLALPKSLDLKPVLLESSIGNKKGVIGATLTLGSGKKIDPSNLLQQASSVRSSNILRQSLALPSLDDLHENFWEKTQNLLSTPLEMTGRNAVEDTLRSSQVLTDNLRVHAENTVKEINQNLASTLKGVGLPSHSGLGSIRSSGNLFEEISRRHEDVNDKLKGISVDLSDRLESLRDSLFDQYRTPSLGSSILGQSILPSLGSAISKPSSTFRTYTKPQNNLKLSTKGKFVTPASKRKSSSRTSSTKGKLKTASSVVAPKTIQMPKFKSAPKESTVLKALRKEPALKAPQFLTRDRPTLGILQPEKNLIDFDRPLLKKPRLGQSKVKISFSTTPPPPAFRNKPTLKADTKLSAKPLSLKDSLPTLAKSASKGKGTSRLSSFRDASGFASEAIPSRVKAPLGIQTNLKASTEDLDIVTTTTLRPTFKISLTKPKPAVGDRYLFKSESLYPDTKSSETELRNNDMPKIPALSWPKKIDDEFLTKVREALRARLAEIGKKTVKPATKTKMERIEPTSDVPDDMAKSASNNNEVVDPQMMKENTSYTCKMMCTKNT